MHVKVQIEGEGHKVELREAGNLTIWMSAELDGDSEVCIDVAELRKALDVIDQHREGES